MNLVANASVTERTDPDAALLNGAWLVVADRVDDPASSIDLTCGTVVVAK